MARAARMIGKLILGVFSALVALFSTGCVYAPPQPRIFGRVTQAGGLAIRGISVKAGDYTNTTTDSDGKYSLYAHPFTDVIVTAEDIDGAANGGQFATESTTVAVSADSDYEVNFELDPES